jgi:hypothetical protein
MTALLIKFAPWLAGVLLVFCAGTYTGWHMNPWESRYKSLQASDAIERIHGEEAVRSALTAQLAQAQATSKNNADSLARLADENAEIIRDRDANLLLARRLLAGQARPTPGSHPLPKAGSGQAPAAASGAGQNEDLASLLVDTADECERNADRLDTLIAQIRPQL